MSGAVVVMPQLGQAMEFGTLTEWLVEDGATVSEGQVIATLESDKAAYELEASASGLLRREAAAGAEILVGGILAIIGEPASLLPAVEPVAASPAPAPANAFPAPSVPQRPLASPRARARARALGVDLHEVQVGDTLIVADAVEAHAATAGAGRSAVAARLSKSWQQAPHFVQMLEVDARRIVAAMTAIREGRLACTLNDLFVAALARTLARFPDVNAAFTDSRLVRKNTIDVGLAVAGQDGLVVPVVRGADAKTLGEIAEATRLLIEVARTKRLDAAQMGRASATISNLGRFGVTFGTPVLNLDEPLLVFIGAIQDRAVVDNGVIVARPIMALSLCFDHRVVDGLRAATVSAAFKEALETLAGLFPESDPAPDADRLVRGRLGPQNFTISLAAGGQHWLLDEPAALGGGDRGPDPVRAVLGGLLGCLMIAFKATADRRKLVIEDFAGQVQSNSKGKIVEIDIRLDIRSRAAESEIHKLLAPAKAACLVHAMLKPDIALNILLRVQTPEEAQA